MGLALISDDAIVLSHIDATRKNYLLNIIRETGAEGVKFRKAVILCSNAPDEETLRAVTSFAKVCASSVEIIKKDEPVVAVGFDSEGKLYWPTEIHSDMADINYLGFLSNTLAFLLNNSKNPFGNANIRTMGKQAKSIDTELGAPVGEDVIPGVSAWVRWLSQDGKYNSIYFRIKTSNPEIMVKVVETEEIIKLRERLKRLTGKDVSTFYEQKGYLQIYCQAYPVEYNQEVVKTILAIGKLIKENIS